MWRTVDNAQSQGLKERPNIAGPLSYLLESHVFSSAGRTGFGECQSSSSVNHSTSIPYEEFSCYHVRQSWDLLCPGRHEKGLLQSIWERFLWYSKSTRENSLKLLYFFQILVDYSNKQELMGSHEWDKDSKSGRTPCSSKCHWAMKRTRPTAIFILAQSF